MTEYWKSQGKKWCQYCKCWMTDNKASIGFHENGAKHKQNVQNRLNEIRKGAAQNNAQNRGEAAILRQMEESAMNSYRENDLKGNSDLTAQIFNQKKRERDDNRKAAEAAAAAHRAISATDEIDEGPSIGPRIPQQSSAASSTPLPSATSQPFKPIKASTSGTEWHKDLEMPDVGENKKDLVNYKKWYEAVSEDGTETKYYWHVETNESRWDPPPEGYLSIQEQVEINRVTELRDIKKNAKIAASQAVHCKSKKISTASEAAFAAATAASSYGPDAKYDPYGGWETVKETKRKDEKPVDWGCPDVKNPVQANVQLHSEKDRYAFKEKTIKSMSKMRETDSFSSGSFSFKKRKSDGSGTSAFANKKQRNIRSRTDDD